jgi:hypothetical protein
MLRACVGQGCKACPYSNIVELASSHLAASRDALEQRLQQDKEYRMEFASPSRDVFQKTASFLTALRKLGCVAPEHEPTILNFTEHNQREKALSHQAKLWRGYRPSDDHCKGRLFFEYDMADKPFIRHVLRPNMCWISLIYLACNLQMRALRFQIEPRPFH